MSMPSAHFAETSILAAQVPVADVQSWLLMKGYYPEQYVLPPCFDATGFTSRPASFFPVVLQGNTHKLKVAIAEHVCISLPKSILTQREFALVDPRHYHDMVMHLCAEWPLVLRHLFDPEQRIYSYSFPIPLNRRRPGHISPLRAGRMIYEFLEMAESDLIAEAHKYKFLLRSDIRNFYASVYTHSIAWALQGKADARIDRSDIDSLGKKLDKLAQYSNDQCTNGIPVGPVISDLISEILLARIDLECSRKLEQQAIDFVGVRFKDDYRFLCQSEEDARTITTALQQCMQEFNLSLSEDKSECLRLPDGLFRPWKAFYKNYSLAARHRLSYSSFERSLQAVLQFDTENPGSGILDKFLSELTTDDRSVKLNLTHKQRRKAFSLLLLLKERRAKTLPVVLAILEAILAKYSEDNDLAAHIQAELLQSLRLRLQKPAENEYEILWLTYFFKTILRSDPPPTPVATNPLVDAVILGRRSFFSDFQDAALFHMPNLPVETNHLLRHLAMFQRHQQEGPEPNPD